MAPSTYGRSFPSVSRSTNPPKLFRVIVPVTDFDRAANFYSKLLSMAGVRVTTSIATERSWHASTPAPTPTTSTSASTPTNCTLP